MGTTVKRPNFNGADQYGGWQDYPLPHSAHSTYNDTTEDISPLSNLPPLLTHTELTLAQ